MGRRILGPAAALVAAALLAVSPLDIMTSHQVRPDIVLETFGILALLVFSSLGDRRGDLRAGCVIGAATAVKFTGLLLVPYYVVARLLAGRRAWSGLLLGLLLSVVIPVACTPYALIHATRFSAGPEEQLFMYYHGGGLTRFAEYLLYYLKDHGTAVGWLAASSAVAASVYWMARDIRGWGPRLLHPLVNIVVMSTAFLVFPRLILPSIAVVVLLAAAPVGLLWSRPDVRSRILGGALGGLMLIQPACASWRYVTRISKPSAEDRILDWFDAVAAPGSRILETRLAANPGSRPGCALGIDRSRFLFIERTLPQDQPDLRLLVPEMDYVITGDDRRGDWADLVQPVFEPRGPGCVPVRVEKPLGALKLRYRPVDLTQAPLASSDDLAHLPALVDGRSQTVWSTGGNLAAPEWIEIRLANRIRVGSLTLESPEWGVSGGLLRVLVDGAKGFRPVRRIVEVVSSPTRQLKRADVAPPRPYERRFVLRDESLIRALRIEQVAPRPGSWTLSEVRLTAIDERP